MDKDLDAIERQAVIDEEKRRKDIIAERLAKKNAVITPSLPPMVIPDTTDLKSMAASGIPALLKKAMLMAYESDNLPQVLGVLKEITDRAHGKAEQSVSARVEVVMPERSLEEVARAMLFAMRDVKERGVIIDGDVV